ncbi:AfsR/SARP family transcriptional regulator, partial [Allorhizocola rhizosphaerae]|uniref:AfsR/SARP family transcriptional regulator n=1 Tax=Allorhizocola rhizosphaerae TaxID=1872709 RepID=UPI0013C342BE
MEFRVLGQLEMATGGVDARHWSPVAARKPRILLAALLVQANELVPTGELIEFIWAGARPRNPRAALQTCATRLRQLLHDAGSKARIVGSDTGYRIILDPTDVDLGLFGILVRAAETAAERGDTAGEADALREALSLWRGEPLAGIDSEALLRDAVSRLAGWRLEILQRRLELDLRLGRHAQVVTELRELVERYPLRERLWWLLISALHRDGRRAEALAAYRDVSAHLAEELGVDPGAELRELHMAVLQGESASPESVARESWLGQCRLPPAVRGFVGRDEAISALLDQLRPRGGVPPEHVVAISGLPGSGKTALALHVAHALRDDYPDGQWYVRLGGAGPSPREPAHVLDELLRTAGVEPGTIPAEPSEREGALRARLADRRLLLVLDDAAGAAQVLPLLPGTPGCAVLITSRATLSGLAAL